MRTRRAGAASLWRPEWLIVARWGRSGEYVSISRTDEIAATNETPILLLPKRTIIAMAHRKTRQYPAAFRLITSVPDGITVGGTFIPVIGRAFLCNTSLGLHLRCKAFPSDCGAQVEWNLDAVSVPWIGEFIERRSLI